jgi:NAD(P)-dependent dehydrogenase (short-subunit alcohol dehydrogenase family)
MLESGNEKGETEMAQRFENKIVLVTGGASGIGLAAARAFAKEGGKVVIADRNGEGAKAMAAMIEAEGGVASGIGVDVTDFAACQAMVDHTVKTFGGLHIAFNNAGIPAPPSLGFTEIPVTDWDKVMDVNVNGIFYCMKAEVPAMLASGGTSIVNTASTAGRRAAANMPSYIASKHAVVGLTKAAGLDLIKHGIRVNAICPGMTATPMMLPLLDDPAMRDAFHAMIPAARVAAPEEIVEGVLFLASGAASYAVGTLLTLDGGLTLC